MRNFGKSGVFTGERYGEWEDGASEVLFEDDDVIYRIGGAE